MTENEILEKYYKMWEEEFYDKYADQDWCYDQLFQSIAYGFFIAKGLEPELAHELYEYAITKGKF